MPAVIPHLRHPRGAGRCDKGPKRHPCPSFAAARGPAKCPWLLRAVSYACSKKTEFAPVLLLQSMENQQHLQIAPLLPDLSHVT